MRGPRPVHRTRNGASAAAYDLEVSAVSERDPMAFDPSTPAVAPNEYDFTSEGSELG